jgi:hypothetical protein
LLAAACSKGKGNEAVFTEPPFTPEVTLAPSSAPSGPSGASSDQLQFETLIGQTIVLHVKSFQPGENVTFTITKPDGSSFTGPPHVVLQDGTVEARYAPPVSGTYTVLAKGDHGDQAQGQFTVSTATAVPQATHTTTHRTTTHTPVPTAHHTPVPTPHHTPAPVKTP